MHTPQWIALAGPTASGKTAISLALADALPVEVVSVDSALVYRGMDVGTAKPSASERARVPHHLVDILDPSEAYSAARFVADARTLVGEIRARGRVPLLVGGTMLYFKALIDGLDAMPASDPAVRAALESEAAERGWPALHAELAQVDAVTAARLPPTDAQRIQRALEVWRSTGRPLSSFQTGRRAATPDGVLLSLEPGSRPWLHERIAQRCSAMLAQGFEDEVRALRARGDLDLQLPSMRCVGYRQAWELMDEHGDGSFDAALWLQRSVSATRQLAKRQLTWLRSLPVVQRVPCDAPGVEHRVTTLVQDVLC